jgi:hypothetical protein
VKILRTLLAIGTAAVIVTAGSATVYAREAALDSCLTDGNTDTGTNALDADKDAQVASAANEADKANGNGEQTTDNANDQCGPDENGDKQNDVAGPGTSNNSDDKDKANDVAGTGTNSNHDGNNKEEGNN